MKTNDINIISKRPKDVLTPFLEKMEHNTSVNINIIQTI